MIKISKNNISSKTLIFCLNSFFVPLVGVYILIGEHSLFEYIVCALIVLLVFLISYRLVNSDYDLFVDKNTNEVVLIKGSIIKKFKADDFLGFRLVYIGSYTSTMYKFYNLVLKGKKYRIRYYVDKLDSYKSLIESDKEMKLVETRLKEEILSHLRD